MRTRKAVKIIQIPFNSQGIWPQCFFILNIRMEHSYCLFIYDAWISSSTDANIPEYNPDNELIKNNNMRDIVHNLVDHDSMFRESIISAYNEAIGVVKHDN